MAFQSIDFVRGTQFKSLKSQFINELVVMETLFSLKMFMIYYLLILKYSSLSNNNLKCKLRLKKNYKVCP